AGRDKQQKLAEAKQAQRPQPKGRPRAPELPRSGRAHTKTPEAQRGDEAPFASCNFPAPLWWQRIRPSVTYRDGELRYDVSSVSIRPPAPEPYRRTPHTLTYYSTETPVQTLFIPAGYIPLQPQDPRARIVPNDEGSYELHLSDRTLPEIA